MDASDDQRKDAVHRVERWLACFDDDFPTEAELDEILSPDVRFLERPNVFNQDGSEGFVEFVAQGGRVFANGREVSVQASGVCT